ncbi:MAG: EamA family transporter [Alphaproteobacteria bacterium]|nr:EamA family transporter [Alphaproteobacteria bacterium]
MLVPESVGHSAPTGQEGIGWLPLVGLGGVVFGWGTGYVAGSVVFATGSGVGPFWATGLRLAVAGLFLEVLGRVKGEDGPDRGHLGLLTLSAGLTWISGTGFTAIGQQTVSAGTTALVFAAAPLLSSLLAGLWAHRAPRRMEIVGMALGVVGLALLIGTGPSLAPHLPWTLVACLSWSVASVLEAGRPSSGGPIRVAALQMGVGAAGLVALALAVGEPLPTPTTSAAWGLVWLLGPTTTLAFPLWLWVLRRLPISVAMLQGTLSPLVATVLGVALLGETVTPLGLLGAAVLLVGARVVLRSATS